MNDGICINLADFTDYACECIAGNFTGRNCETKNPCLSSPCIVGVCLPGDDYGVVSKFFIIKFHFLKF